MSKPLSRAVFLLLTLAGGGVCSAVVPAAAPHALLEDALLCRGDSLGVVQDLVAAGSRFDQGYAVASIGEEIDTQSLVVLERPLQIAGASTRLVLAGPTPHETDFNGLVYARFHGDHKVVIQQLGLQEPASGDAAAPIGRFQKAVAADADADAAVCPPTIGLTPLEGGEFLLGCGWCNG